MPDPNRLTAPHVWGPFVSALVAIGALITAIVVWNQQPSPPPPLMLADAQRRATDDLRQIADGAIGSLTPDYQLEPKPVQVLKCRAPNGLDSGQQIAVVTYLVHGITPDRISDSFLVLRAWLPEYGWDVHDDLVHSGRFLNALRDGYLMSARLDTTTGGIVLGNSTPCANPS
jgi:hypothetical protein